MLSSTRPLVLPRSMSRFSNTSSGQSKNMQKRTSVFSACHNDNNKITLPQSPRAATQGRRTTTLRLLCTARQQRLGADRAARAVRAALVDHEAVPAVEVVGVAGKAVDEESLRTALLHRLQ